MHARPAPRRLPRPVAGLPTGCTSGTALALLVGSLLIPTVDGARAQVSAAPPPSGDWRVIGRQHVRDNAEKDLAFLHDSDNLVEVRVCAEGQRIRLRNAQMWLPGDKRQRLWLPLSLDAGVCSKGNAVQGGAKRVTHIAFEYEARGLGVEGAHLRIEGRQRAAKGP